MKISLISLGHKMPGWVDSAFQMYNDRLPGHLKLHLVELTPVSRHKGLSVSQIKSQEASILEKHTLSGTINVALDERGKAISTPQVATILGDWQMEGRDVNIIIGGADGLDQRIIQQASHCWSLSRLVFPHQLVRVIVAEQLYRAWSLLNNHPYHRE
ncbi:23S rRNA (pseudouridine(1915)-N(3))-methyltransferase RlmH [Marinicella sediminis]|uniref:Ribosomal RNA large subunit methyltransferase H n=1 Tax=Marinicella sediminis TaxID=1792834 RepID=A0ABV7J7N0_9GAMM|nr:23S rRNA (pseudouridine(1915)-N(3))-methyltransferase RlmH [Marinicella sediminis]